MVLRMRALRGGRSRSVEKGYRIQRGPGANGPIEFAAERVFSETYVFTTIWTVFWGTGSGVRPPLLPSLTSHGGILNSAEEAFVFLCFPNVFRRAPLQRTGIRVVHSGPRWARLNLLGSGFCQKHLFLQRF